MDRKELNKLKRKMLLIKFIYHPITESTRYINMLFEKLPDGAFKIFLSNGFALLRIRFKILNQAYLTVQNDIKPYFKLHRKVVIALPFLYYAILLITNTLKFESTFLILFFILFVNLLYVNIYNYINVELDKYTFNMYLTYKETVARRIKKVKSNVTFFKLRKNRIKTIVKRLTKIIAITYVRNFNHFKPFNRFTLVFFVHTFATSLVNAQLNFKKI